MVFSFLVSFVGFDNISKSAHLLSNTGRKITTLTTDHAGDIPSNRSNMENGINKTVIISELTYLNVSNINGEANRPHSIRYPDVKRAIKTVPVIMFWTNGPTIMWWGITREGPEYFSTCKQSCIMTRNKSRITEASVIAFFHVDKHPVWPTVRLQNQSYVHFLNERPGRHHATLIEYNGKINITWCSRRDADVPQHAVVVPRVTTSSVKEYKPRIPLANKTKSVVWPVSHCNASSKRDIYTQELSKHIDVDIYGKCGTLICPRSEKCMRYFERTYKFYLGFENSICKDYITEKFYGLVHYELIPIVMGGGDYDVAAPPHSFINVRDYESPRHLAKYLNYLTENEEEYYSYFKWRSHYMLQNSNPAGNCLLCDIAHNITGWARPAREDYYDWWFSGCDDTLVDQMRAKGNW